MESIRNSMDPRAKENIRKNMKIPRKEEKPEQPVIKNHKITSLI
jgi:hypothetical protein